MSSKYYFKQWRSLLVRLKETLNVDIEYQKTKANDKKRSDAVQRLSGMLGKYISLYNQLVECSRSNLQVQKVRYMEELVRTLVARIIELQHQISKLEGCNVQFLSKSLIDHKLTTDDVELTDIPDKVKRPEHVKQALEDSKKRAEEEKKRLEEEAKQAELEEYIEEEHDPWWAMANKGMGFDDDIQTENEEKKLNDAELELMRRKDMLNLIAAHEKTRQVAMQKRRRISTRETWAKELAGTLQPAATIELRQRAAQIVQRFARAYFVAKRRKIEDCKRDEILGFRICKIHKSNDKFNAEEMMKSREHTLLKCQNEWQREITEMKQNLSKKREDAIAEDYRDEIRDWFQQWYKKAIFFHDIPSEKKGGTTLIWKEELATPSEWLEQYKTYQAMKGKIKTSEQLRQEKLAAKQEAKLKKKEEQIKKKMEDALMRKIMKNPSQHPGYTYPQSKKINDIVKALENYHTDWDFLDAQESLEVKEKFIKSIEESNIWMEIKMEVRTKVDEDMRKELNKLRNALKEDYERREEEMPEMIPEPKKKRQKKKKKVKNPFNKTIPDLLMDLTLKGVLREYTQVTFEEFMGDANFAGEDLRAELIPPTFIGAETRRAWWERVRQMVHGQQRILVIGPKGSGKTSLAYMLATINDAVFFDLNLDKFDEDIDDLEDLKKLAISIAACARAVQPSVIFIKHVHLIYLRKKQTEGPALDQESIMRFLIKPLFKKIQKTDSITIIGTCVDPWLTKANKLLRQFPNTLLMPTTSYSLTLQILRTWMIKNREIPSDLDVHSLAYMLQGYGFGFLTKTLQDYVSADHIVKIAASGLQPEEVFNFILENETEEKPDYAQYLKWYNSKTQQGKSEQKHLADQRAYRDIERQWQEKMAKKKKPQSAAPSVQSSVAGSR